MLNTLLTIIIFAIILAAITDIVRDLDGEVHLDPLLGVMLGFIKEHQKQELINKDTQETVGYRTEHILQVCIVCLSITFIWYQNINE